MVAMDFFEASNFYDFFNQYCLNLLKNPTVRGLNSKSLQLKTAVSGHCNAPMYIDLTSLLTIRVHVHLLTCINNLFTLLTLVCSLMFTTLFSLGCSLI